MNLFFPSAAQVQADQPLQTGDEFARVKRAAARPQREDFAAIVLPAAKEELFVLLPLDDHLEVSPVTAPQVADVQIAARNGPRKTPLVKSSSPISRCQVVTRLPMRP